MTTAIALNAPVRSIEMLDLQIKAGANEVYVGLPAEPLKVWTFNARARKLDEQPCQVPSLRALRGIVDEAHAAGLTVHFSANVQHLPPSLHAAYRAQVAQALDAGADGLIVANVGLARLLRDAGVTAPMTAGLYMNVGTTRLARYLRDQLAVRRIVLPHAMKLTEVRQFAALDGVTIEVPAHTGGGNTCGRCMMFDSAAVPEFGSGCRSGYDVTTPDGTVLPKHPFLDGATDCSLCSVADLIAAGVTAFKIPGRESPNVKANAKITQLYRKLIDDSLAAKPLATSIREIDRVELMWQMRWVPRFCNAKRCKFEDTPYTQSYV
uniref:Peptidase n=1 Tax=uncultured Acidobacteria bacterium A3 TaxID=1036853 RepID=F8TTH1_9BACT|nr:peptidase [uncultured Acidobacteria bacterium A3]